jgi:hypothetical protein
MPHPKIEKWRGWCGGQIHNELVTVSMNRRIFREIVRITDARGDLPRSYVWAYLRETYATTQAVAIRRQADTRRRVFTLARLLRALGKNPSRLSRKFYIDNYDPDDKALAEVRFDERFADGARKHIDLKIIASDLKLIGVYASRVKTYVDHHVALSPGEPTTGFLALDELDFAIDGISQLFEKYADALMGPARPIISAQLDPEWIEVFRVPWMPLPNGLFTATVGRSRMAAKTVRNG